MKIQNVPRKFAAASLALLLPLAFQNCITPSDGSSKPQSSSAEIDPFTPQGTGNATGYDGKAYVLVAVPGQCPVGVQVRKEIVVRDSDQRAFVVKDNCQPLAQPVDVTQDLEFVVPHPLYDIRILDGEVFDYAADPDNVFNLIATKVRCQIMTAPDQGISLAIIIEQNGLYLYKASSYIWTPNATPVFTEIPSGGVRRTTTAAGYLYSRTNPDWSLQEISDPNDPLAARLKGDLVFDSVSGLVSVPGMDCFRPQSGLRGGI